MKSSLYKLRFSCLSEAVYSFSWTFRGKTEDILAVKDLIECLKTGREPVLAGRKVLQATELIFATYKSRRRRTRIYLPLDIEDSLLLSMLESGTIGLKIKTS